MRNQITLQNFNFDVKRTEATDCGKKDSQIRLYNLKPYLVEESCVYACALSDVSQDDNILYLVDP